MRYRKVALALFVSSVLVLGINLDTVRASIPGVNDPVIYSQGAAPGALSHDARYVAFKTSEPLVAGDTNGYLDIFVKDRTTGTITRASVASDGTQANNNSQIVSLSDNGRLVAFESEASNLVSGDTNGVMDIFVHDMQTGTTQLVSSSSSGGLGNNHSQSPMISGDGQFVVFNSMSNNLVSTATAIMSQVYVKNLLTGELQVLSENASGVAGNGGSYYPSISCDGGVVTFQSYASNLVAGDINAQTDIFVVTRAGGDSISNVTINGNNHSAGPAISCDGMYVAYTSGASNLVASDSNGQQDAFRYDRRDGSTLLISVSSSGAQGDAASYQANISGDGRLIAWTSNATNFVSDDTNGVYDVFMRDTVNNATYRVSVNESGQQGDGASFAYNGNMDGSSAFSNDSKYLYFSSKATNFAPYYVPNEWSAFVAKTGL